MTQQIEILQRMTSSLWAVSLCWLENAYSRPLMGVFLGAFQQSTSHWHYFWCAIKFY